MVLGGLLRIWALLVIVMTKYRFERVEMVCRDGVFLEMRRSFVQ